ncbi:MAG: hypothetical protein E7649_07925 [Ruminococcaceae bacterium]|nr:hypothetical protein [Oscillospiraceae bacterium]
MFFKKKKSGPVDIKLKEDQFCCTLEDYSADVKNTYCVMASADNYYLLYRDGQFMGMPRPFGGPIYPFSTDPTKQGSNKDRKKFHTAKIVCLSKDFNLKVNWGTKTAFVLSDINTNKAFKVGARGTFYVNIDPTDAARKADQFYSKCISQRNAELFNTEALRDFLCESFVTQIGAKIQEYMEEEKRSLENYVGLMPAEILKISEDLCPKMKDVFGHYGLTIVPEASSSSILVGLEVNEIIKN